MKYLKKFYIIFIFSLLIFIPKTKAVAQYNFTNNTNITAIDNYLMRNPSKTINDFVDLLSSHIDNLQEEIGDNNYIFYIENYPSTSYPNYFRFYYVYGDFHIATDLNNSKGILRLYKDTSLKWGYIDFRFLNNYRVLSVSSTSSTTDSTFLTIASDNTIWPFFLYSSYDSLSYKQYSWSNYSFSINNVGQYSINSDVPISSFISSYYNFEIFDYYNPYNQPTYTINQEILPNGNVKLLFNFTDYIEGSGYGFTITNKVSGEEYGIPNPYTSIYPNIIPFGNSYEIILGYDTVITVSLSKYTLIEGSQLYDREPLYVDSYDINNVVFDNIAQPYFSVLFQTKSNIIGVFNNTDNTMSCYYKFSNSSTESQLNCTNSVNLDFPNNGFVEFIIKKQNNVIYSRKINILGGSESEPYIVYNIEKQDFYTRVNWYVQNYNNQLKFRYSLDNGLNFSTWALLSNNQQFLNVFENSVVIIEISDNSESTIFDSKAINVIVSVENLKNFNNTTNNLIDKFNNIFSVNGNILANIELMWNTIKTSKIYLFVFIPFITSIICAIIYLIRR